MNPLRVCKQETQYGLNYCSDYKINQAHTVQTLGFVTKPKSIASTHALMHPCNIIHARARKHEGMQFREAIFSPNPMRSHPPMSCDFLPCIRIWPMYLRSTVRDHKMTCTITLHKINFKILQIDKSKIPDPCYYALCLSRRSLISNKHKDLAQLERSLALA